ncbi:NAD-dependent epimerase/dehydratase family protein [Epibacterium sp. SM1969]|uniref:NAD-dependent epimerase/dehydratase family protein n=1 Tax=Tritonibacter aquimaris TaxID=2663379 RepID=A0A844AU56_9RHOB|nr:complex I NDUFA9 subunit family protein [Tritonibacter aquimaris]MQY41934.1 NAD-dependent epimerase/dehydratase family protein [Tritonibacter aquimaris]
MSKLVTIFGGSGFVGRYIARRMAKEGWRVRVAVRRPNEAMHVKPYGVPGQVEPVFCNIRDDASVASVLEGADAAVNCVGVLNGLGKNTFEAVQAEGAERVARLAAEAGLKNFVHVSAIGADAQSASKYARSKAAGEAGVLEHQPDAVILRPSVIFGPEDEFFNRFAAMARLSPMLPIAYGATKFQPVYVDDVAQAAAMAVLGDAKPGIYELGGPEAVSFRGLMQRMLAVIHRKSLILSMPGLAARAMAGGFDLMQKASFQLIENKMLTVDQVKNLRTDNVVSQDALSFADLDIAPINMEAVLPDYLWKFRPSGQYDEMVGSARNLRDES